MSIKYCTSCGEEVDGSVKFCPNCRSTSFRYQSVPAKVKPTLIQSLFYWQYDGRFIISKTKTGSMFLFILFVFMSAFAPIPAGMLLLGVFVTLIVYLIGYLIHILKGKPTEAQLENSDCGFLIDLKNLLFYWQNKNTGEFVLSKTKIICIAIYLLIVIIGWGAPNIPLASMLLFSLVFTAPVYVIGFAVHKLTNPNPTNPKLEQKPKKPKVYKKKLKPVEAPAPTPEVSIDEFSEYREELVRLKEVYAKKDAHARELIDKKFEPPQMTNAKFISVVDGSKKLFDKEADNVSSIISLATEKSPRVEKELDHKFEILNSLIDKMDDLINELVLSLDSTKKDDVHGLLDEMESLVDSVKNYE